MNTTFDVAVVGGGIIGTSIAYYLSKEGLDVAVFEQQQIAAESTSAAAGMLGAHSEGIDLEVFYPFARKSQLDYFSLQNELKEQSGIDIELKRGGIFQLVYSEIEKQNLQATIALPTVQWYERQAVLTKEAVVTSDIIGAAYIEDDVSVLPTSVCQAFCKSAQNLGASLFEYTPVLSIQKQNGTYSIQTLKGTFTAKYVVIASGVWSTTFFKQLGLNYEITPVKGECISVYSDKPVLTHTLYHEQNYIMPRNNGRLVIGATMVRDDWSRNVTTGGIEKLLTKAKSMLPTITDMKIESFWAGLRPDTFDRKPFIGRHPEDDQLLFATGHYRNGILLAPATGQMIRDLIVNKPVQKEVVEAFKIDRGVMVR